METKCNYKTPDRTGLYIMVFLAMMGACDAQHNSSRALQNTEQIERKIDQLIKMNHDQNAENTKL